MTSLTASPSAPPPLTPPPIRVPASRNPRWWFWLGGAGGLVGLAVLWQFEPSGQVFFPRCWLFQTTGLQCPGCGATRALHALLNGRLADAFRLNPLVVASLPAAGWLALRAAWGWRTGRWWTNPFVHPTALAILAGLTLGFGLARNLSW